MYDLSQCYYFSNLVSKVSQLLDTLLSSSLCMGNSENEFLQLPSVRKGLLEDHSSKLLLIIYYSINNTTLYFTETNTVAVVDSRRTGVASIIHVQCRVLLKPSSISICCESCTQLWKSLASLATRAARGPHLSKPIPVATLLTLP